MTVHPDTYLEYTRVVFSHVDYCMSNVHCKLSSFFGFGTTPKIYSSLDRDLNVQIHLGMHQRKTCKKLVYDYHSIKNYYFPWTNDLTFLNMHLLLFIKTNHLII